MQLQELLDRIEDAAHDVRLGIAGQLLDASIGDEIDVELRPHPLHDLCQV